MKNLASIKKILTVFVLLSGMLFSSVAFAMKPQIVLFCSSWNLKCREARKACNSAASDLGMKYTDLDVDQASTQQKADDLGLSMPSAIPYIYVLDEKGNIKQELLYSGESSQKLKQKISN